MKRERRSITRRKPPVEREVQPSDLEKIQKLLIATLTRVTDLQTQVDELTRLVKNGGDEPDEMEGSLETQQAVMRLLRSSMQRPEWR